MVKSNIIKLSLATAFAAVTAMSMFALTTNTKALVQEVKKEIKVSPILECVVPTGEDTFKVFWGYENKSMYGDEQYTVPAAEVEQKFTGGEATLPTEFGYPMVIDGRPGRTAFDQAEPNAFTTTLTAGEKQVWTLNGKTSTASEETKRCPVFFQFDKAWEGDAVNASDVTVEFTADGEFSWTLGVDAPVKVEPGETTLTNVKEVVTGLPENCTYESDVPSEITAPEAGYDENGLFTLTVTNTVECEDEDDGEVLADTTEEPQVTVTPVGAADAGAGNTIALGLAGSTAIVALGVAVKKFTV